VATRADGTLVGIRKPLAAHEQPIIRTYVAVEDIQQAMKTAEESGAFVVYGPTQQGQRGTFAILIFYIMKMRALRRGTLRPSLTPR